MSHIIFIIEEPSMEKALNNIIPQIINDNTFEILTFNGRSDLLSKLPSRFQGYKKWIPKDYYLFILLDKDEDDCLDLKNKLEQIAQSAALTTKTSARTGQNYQVVNRIVIEELESWFFGDIEAINIAFPRILPTIIRKKKYRNPDSITEGTKESLNRLFKKNGYYQNIPKFPKLEVADKISKFMKPDRNRSKSFQVFYKALQEII